MGTYTYNEKGEFLGSGARNWSNWLVVLIWIVTCCLNIGAQNLLIRPYPFAHQLYTNHIYEIFQDQEGYIWIGTSASLQRWDGHWLMNFRNTDEQTYLLADNNISNIADTRQLLWICTSSGLTLYDKQKGHFFPPADKRILNKWINGICNDNADGIWLAIGTQLYHCNATCTNIESVNPFGSQQEKHQINAIYTDTKGFLWVMCGDGTLMRGRDGMFDVVPSIPKGIACTMFEDADGHYWFGTWGQGLWQYLPEGEQGTGESWVQHHVHNDETGSEESIFFCIQQDKTKRWLWMLSYKKLYVFQYDSGKLNPIDLAAYSLPRHDYTNMICDNVGNIWLAANDESSIVSFDSSGIFSFRTLQPSWQTDGDLCNVYADGNYIWLNWQRNGLQLYDRKQNELTSLHNLNLPEMSVIRPSRGKTAVWVAQKYYSSAYRLIQQQNRVTVDEKVDLEAVLNDSQPIIDLVEDGKGVVWMLTPRHLAARINDLNRSIAIVDIEEPTAIAQSPRTSTLLCAAGRNLHRCKAEERYLTSSNVATFDMLSDNERVIAMSLDSTNCLWLATSMGRTFCSDRSMKNFKPSPVDSLLSDGLIEDILSTPNSVWLMNVNKVVCFDLRRQVATVYQTTDDLVNILRFRHRVICQDGDGVLAGGYGGFTYLPERRKNINTPVVSPVLTDVLVDGTSIFFDANGASESTFSHVVLPSDAHNIELRLSQLAYYAGTRRPLQYRLKGFEDRWSELESTYPHVAISSLPCGTFNLEVRIAQSDGRWGEPLLVTKVKRLPAWYETVLAHFLYLLLAIVALAGMAWLIQRRQQRRLNTEVLQAKVLAITVDHHLTDKMIAIIDHHLDDSDFGLEQLLAEIGMSKSTLYRQLKTETDMTPSDFIRNIRMKRACEMLLSQKMTVAEVAYATGFSNPKYFTRCFKDIFGKTPTEYIRSQQKLNEQPDGEG